MFVNRSLSLDKIKFFGFDMDYTLAGKLKNIIKFYIYLDPLSYRYLYMISQAYKRSSRAGLFKAWLSYPMISKNLDWVLWFCSEVFCVYWLAFCFDFE